MTNHLIIIRGPAGSGKTTIAKILADRMRIKHIALDELLAKARLDRVDTKLGCIPIANFLAIQEDILSEIEKQIKTSSIIIDGNFYFKEQIEFFKNNWKLNTYVITLTCKLETCINRDLRRKNPIGKKAITEIYNLVSKFEYGFVVNIDGKTREHIVEQIQRGLLENRQ